MALQAGTTLGPYQVTAKIGEGGMGEVYKARDTRLDRTVAIKVLPEAFTSDPVLKQRFEREAKTISSLNHPHICTLYDIGSQDGMDFLVMEYLDGETLAQRLEKGALPLDQALTIAIEIADALDKAHRQGITHRDLKPGNIMLTAAGAKLLDFGLAKLRKPGTVGAERFSAATTVSGPLTGEGKILGTLQYMAPEQLEGKEADARTDIFAFGALVYEMVTGRRAFVGDSHASLIASILDREPVAIATLQPISPPALNRVVDTCLAKRPDDRWQTVADLRRQLTWIAESGVEAGVAAVAPARPGPARWRQMIPWIAGALLGGAIVSLWVLRSTAPESSPVTRFEIPVAGSGGEMVAQSTLTLSPDGRTLVYTADRDVRLHWRPLDQLDDTAIVGTENAYVPFFSPDGQWVGFFERSLTRGTLLKKIRLGGESPVTLRDDLAFAAGASWGPGDVIVFGDQNPVPGLYRMSASGGEPERITTVDTDAGEFAHAAPEWLPGGRSVLFTVIPRTSAPEQIAVASLETGEHRVLLEGSHPRYVGTGHLFFRRGTTLWRVPFDARDAQLAGEPVPVLEGVRAAPRSASFALGGNGSLAYFPERGQTESPRALVWVDRQGQEEELPLPPRSYVWPRVSPDGMHAAVWTIDSRDVWVTELERGTLSRLTTYEGNDTTPLWTPSGERVVFQSTRAPRGLYSKAADGTGTVELLLRANEDWAFMNPMSWSGDGRTLVFHYWSHDTAGDIGVLPMGGE